MKNILLSPIQLEELLTQIELIIEKIFKLHLPTLLPKTHELPEWPTRIQTAKYLSVSLVTLNKWSRQGLIHSYKIGGQVRYNRDEIMLSLQKVKNLKYKREK